MQNYDMLKYNHAVRQHINFITALIINDMHMLPVVIADTIINTLNSLLLPAASPTIPKTAGLHRFFKDNKITDTEYSNLRSLLFAIFKIYEEGIDDKNVLPQLTLRLNNLYTIIRTYTYTDIYIYGKETPKVSSPDSFINIGIRDLLCVDSESFGGVSLVDEDMWDILLSTIPKTNYRYFSNLHKRFIKIKKVDTTARIYAKQEILLPNNFVKDI